MLGIERMMLISSIAWWVAPSGPTEMPPGARHAHRIRGAAGREGAVGREERDLAHRRQPGRDVAHVLLGDADLDEAVGELLREEVHHGRLAEVADQHHDARVLLAQVHQRPAAALARLSPLPLSWAR